jgi:hypothetical protein
MLFNLLLRQRYICHPAATETAQDRKIAGNIVANQQVRDKSTHLCELLVVA